MNRIGIKSNTGEGGRIRRYVPVRTAIAAERGEAGGLGALA
jgi:hypothetical protein